jgi:hypothetical protein
LAIAHTVIPGTTMLMVSFFNRTGGGAANLDLYVGTDHLVNVGGVSGEVPQFWYLLNPPIGAITLNITDPTYQTIVEGAVYNVTGNDATLPVGNLGAITGYGTRILTAAIPSTPNSLIIDCAGVSETLATPVQPLTPGAGQTELFDQLNAIDTHHRGAGSQAPATGAATITTYTMTEVPINVMFLYAAVAIHGTPIPILQPSNILAIRRTNYVVVRWSPLTQDWTGKPAAATAYIVQRASFVDESDLADLATITTVDAQGQVDTAFVDTSPPPAAVYRVISIMGSTQSDPSGRAVAIESPSTIDEKTELLDEKLLFWDDGNWDEKQWS